jgi:hypothetical protein
MNFSCLHQHASAFFNNFISQSSSPSWIKGLWFKRSVARIVLISFTFGQLAPLVPAHASCQEESQDQSQSPSTPLLVRSAQQNEPRDPAPRVPAIQGAAPQPQAQTMSELLLARLAAHQAQNPVPAPVVSAPKINAAPQPQDLTRSKYLLGRLAAQQAQTPAPVPIVQAPRINAASQPQAQTMRELLLARLAAHQAQNPVPAPVVSAPRINAAPQPHAQTMSEFLLARLAAQQAQKLMQFENQLPTIRINLTNPSPRRYVLSSQSSASNGRMFEATTFDLDQPDSLNFRHGKFEFNFSEVSGLEIGYLPRKFNYILNIAQSLHTKRSLGIKGYFDLQSALSYTCDQELWAEQGIRLRTPLVMQTGDESKIHSRGKVALYTQLLKSGTGRVKGSAVILNAARLEGQGRIKAQKVTLEDYLHSFDNIKASKIIWSLKEGRIIDQPLITSTFLKIKLSPQATKPLHLKADIQSEGGFKIKAPHVICQDLFFPLSQIEANKITWSLNEGGTLTTPLTTPSFLEIEVSPQAITPLYIKTDIQANRGYKVKAPHVVWQMPALPLDKIESPKITWSLAEGTLISTPLVTSGFFEIMVNPRATRPLHLLTPIHTPRGFKLKAPQVVWQLPTVPPLNQIEADRIQWSLNEGLIINSPLLTPSFLEIAVHNPRATRPLHIQADITANKGLKFTAPKQILVGVENRVFPKLQTQGPFESTSQTFDLVHGLVSAASALIHAPLGISIGRLVKDPTRDLFATFYCHGQYSGSHNLGGDIVPASYQFLGKPLTNTYDGRHLLTLPIAIGNSSSFHVKGLTEFKGPLLHRGTLETENFILDSPKDSTCEAGVIKVSKDFNLKGGGNLSLKRYIGELPLTYYMYNGYRRPSQSTLRFAGSDPAELNVYGTLSADPQATIFNHSSILYAHQKTP